MNNRNNSLSIHGELKIEIMQRYGNTFPKVQ